MSVDISQQLCRLPASKGLDRGQAIVFRSTDTTSPKYYLTFVKTGELPKEDTIKANSVLVNTNEIFPKVPAQDEIRDVPFLEGQNSVIRSCYVELPATLSVPSPENALTHPLIYYIESLIEFNTLNKGPHDNVCHFEGVQTVGDRRLSGVIVRHFTKKLAPATPEERHEYKLEAGKILEGVRAGLDALHRVNLAVNFLNPGSVALDKINRAVLLGPFAKFNDNLTYVHKPPSWKEAWGNPKKSSKQNDEEAFIKLKEWLEGTFEY